MPGSARRRLGAMLVAGVLLAAAPGCGAKHSEERATGSIGGSTWSRDGKRIAWSEFIRGVGARIWISRPDMSNPRPVGPPLDALGELAWLPDHELLYWANSRLFRLRPGARSTLVTLYAGEGFVLDAAATHIATGDPPCSTGCNGGILVFDLNGAVVRRISPNTQSTSPTFSPDGRRLAFARNLCDSTGRCERPVGIWTASIETGTLERLTRTGSCPDWSPDGRTIAYLEYAPLAGYALRVIPASGGGSVLLLHARDGGCPLWAPNSRLLAILARSGSTFASTLRIVDVRTHRARSISRSVIGDAIAFAWAPDSRRLLVRARPTDRLVRRCGW